jgi:hypothetical protein
MAAADRDEHQSRVGALHERRLEGLQQRLVGPAPDLVAEHQAVWSARALVPSGTTRSKPPRSVRSAKCRTVTSSRSAGFSAAARMIWNAMLPSSRLAVVPDAGAVLHEHPHPSHARSQDTQPQRWLRAHDENASESGSYSTGDDYRAALARRDIDR